MPITTPVQMFSGSSASVGMIPMEGPGVGGGAQTYGPFRRGLNLFSVMQQNQSGLGNSFVKVMKSTDDGATWSILDDANSPIRYALDASPALISGAFWDGADTITVAYNPTHFLFGGVGSAVVLLTFDLISETWGSVFGTVGAPIVNAVNQIFIRPDGSLILFTNRTMNGSSARGTRAIVFASGIWGSPFNVDTNVTAGFNGNGVVYAVMDSATGIIHLFLKSFDGAFNTLITYQQVLLNNTLGNFTNIPDGTLIYEVMEGLGNPVIVGNSLVWGVVDVTGTGPGILIGTPLINPIFSAPGGIIDPGFVPPAYSTLMPNLWLDGSLLWAMYQYTNTSGATLIRVGSTPNLLSPSTGWTFTTCYDTSLGSVQLTYPGYCSFSIVSGEGLMTVQALAIGATYGDPTAYFLSFLSVLSTLSDPWFHLFT